MGREDEVGIKLNAIAKEKPETQVKKLMELLKTNPEIKTHPVFIEILDKLKTYLL